MGVMACPVPLALSQGCSAMRMWRNACSVLMTPDMERAWQQLVEASPPDTLWHSLRNCVAYQAGVWQNLLNKGVQDAIQPAAFKFAIVLRHTPSELAVQLLSDLLKLHPQSQDLTSYILTLLTDDEAHWDSSSSPEIPESPETPDPSSQSSTVSSSSESNSEQEEDDEHEPSMDSDNEAEAVPVSVDNTEQQPRDKRPPPASPDTIGQPDSAMEVVSRPDSPSYAAADSAGPGSVETMDLEDVVVEAPRPRAISTPAGPAPLRDLQLFGDCELAVLAASREEYDAHAKLVRAEYSKLTQHNYVELRIKVLNQFSQIPKLFHTEEFACLEAAARENIEREISTLREHLLTGEED